MATSRQKRTANSMSNGLEADSVNIEQRNDPDQVVTVDFEKLPSGYYRVTPKQPLPPGEYAFLRELGSGRAYDFGRD